MSRRRERVSWGELDPRDEPRPRQEFAEVGPFLAYIQQLRRWHRAPTLRVGLDQNTHDGQVLITVEALFPERRPLQDETVLMMQPAAFIRRGLKRAMKIIEQILRDVPVVEAVQTCPRHVPQGREARVIQLRD